MPFFIILVIILPGMSYIAQCPHIYELIKLGFVYPTRILEKCV